MAAKPQGAGAMGRLKRACSIGQPRTTKTSRRTIKINANVTGEIEMRFQRRPLSFLGCLGFGSGADSD